MADETFDLKGFIEFVISKPFKFQSIQNNIEVVFQNGFFTVSEMGKQRKVYLFDAWKAHGNEVFFTIDKKDVSDLIILQLTRTDEKEKGKQIYLFEFQYKTHVDAIRFVPNLILQ